MVLLISCDWPITKSFFLFQWTILIDAHQQNYETWNTLWNRSQHSQNKITEVLLLAHLKRVWGFKFWAKGNGIKVWSYWEHLREHIENLGKHVPNALGFWVARILVALAKEMVSHPGHWKWSHNNRYLSGSNFQAYIVKLVIELIWNGKGRGLILFIAMLQQGTLLSSHLKANLTAS